MKNVSDEQNFCMLGGRDVCDAKDLIVIGKKMFVLPEI